MRPEKATMLKEITDKLSNSKYVIMADCRGLKVEQMSALRSELRKAGAGIQVVKNTFLGVAAKGLGYPQIDEMLKGPTAMIAGPADVTAIAKVIMKFAEDTKLPKVKGGILGNLKLSSADVESLAKLPGKKVMQGMFVGTLAAPMTKLVGTMNAKVCSLLYVLKAVEDKKKAG